MASTSATSCSDSPPKYQHFDDLSLSWVYRRQIEQRLIEVEQLT
jgi:hypothetical protein